MKAGWQALPLEELCDLTSGLWTGKKGPFKTVGVIRNTNFNVDGSLDDLDIAFIDVEEGELAKKTLQYGDVILEKSGGGPKQPVGRVALYNVFEREFSFSNFTAAIRVKRPAILSFRYLHLYLYWLHLNGTTEKIQSHSTGIRNLNLPAYKKLPIPFPTKQEQERIVAILDKAFEGISSVEHELKEVQHHTQATFSSFADSLFVALSESSSKKPLAEMCERITKGSSPKWQGISYVDVPGVLFVTSENVREFSIDITTPKYVEEKFNLKDKKSILRKGDVLTNIVGASIGRTAVYDGPEQANINQAVCLIRCKDHLLDNEFLMYFLNSYAVKEFLHANEVNTARANLSLGFFSSLQIPQISLAEQQKTVRSLSAVRNQLTELDGLTAKKFASLAALKQSLLHQAFSGNL